MVSPSLTRVRELVSKLADPKLPRFTHLLTHTAAWPVSSCRARPEAWPKKVSGIGPLECVAGALHIFVLVLHIWQKKLIIAAFFEIIWALVGSTFYFEARSYVLVLLERGCFGSLGLCRDGRVLAISSYCWNRLAM